MKSFLRRLYRKAQYAAWAGSSEGRAGQARLAALQGAHAGRRAFIIGNGPSLKQTPMPRLADDITIGCNGLFLLFRQMGFTPTYYTVEDALVAEDRGREISGLKGTQKIVPFDLRRHITDPEALLVNFVRSYQPFPQFSWQLDRIGYWGGTVTFFNLQLAAYLGCNPIVLVGIDHSYNTQVAVEKDGPRWKSLEDDPNHFDPSYFGKGYRWHDPNVERMETAYRCAKAECERRQVKILNATVGGKLEVFPRVTFPELGLG